MSKRKDAEGNWVGGLIKSLVVALMFGGIVWMADQKTQPQASAAKMVVAPAKTAASSTVILFGVPAPSASSDKLFAATLPDGTVKERNVEPGWRITRMATLPLTIQASGKSDGGFVLSGTDWDVPLRTKSAAPYQEIALLGMWDASHAALTAQTNGRVVLSVSRLGEVREAYRIPENANALGFRGGAAWFATYQPGEGIESPPQGPSDLVRVDASGTSTVMATSPQIITSVVVGDSRTFAYQTETGEVFAQRGERKWYANGRPLLWLDDHRLLFAKGIIVSVVDLETDAIQNAATLPLAPTAAQLEP